jgi:hypothetical protein
MDIRVKIPPSTKRVELHTKKKINEMIEEKTINNLGKYKNADPETLSRRLEQLNREWDTERVLEANAAGIIFISTILGFTISQYWFILIGIVSFFLLQHAVQGWCPPLPIIRRLGVRTPEEISDEKVSIKYLRGDFALKDRDTLEIMEVIKED